MSDSDVIKGWGPGLASYTTNPVLGAIASPGMAVRRSAGTVIPAIANAAAPDATVVGLTNRHGDVGHRVPVQFGGLFTLPAAEWDAVTGQTGGLTPGAQYYLSDADAGHLVIVPPVGGSYVAPLGIAWSATTMQILPQAPVATTP